MRCDETWPACDNCTKTGRCCDGVASASASANDSGAQSQQLVTFAAPLTLSHFQPAKFGFGGAELSREDGVYLDLFRRELVTCIVGPRAAWRRLVLRAVHEEPALCHAGGCF